MMGPNKKPSALKKPTVVLHPSAKAKINNTKVNCSVMGMTVRSFKDSPDTTDVVQPSFPEIKKIPERSIKKPSSHVKPPTLVPPLPAKNFIKENALKSKVNTNTATHKLGMFTKKFMAHKEAINTELEKKLSTFTNKPGLLQFRKKSEIPVRIEKPVLKETQKKILDQDSNDELPEINLHVPKLTKNLPRHIVAPKLIKKYPETNRNRVEVDPFRESPEEQNLNRRVEVDSFRVPREEHSGNQVYETSKSEKRPSIEIGSFNQSPEEKNPNCFGDFKKESSPEEKMTDYLSNFNKKAMLEGERLDYVRNFKKEAMPEGERLDYVRNFNKEAIPEGERLDYVRNFNKEAIPEGERLDYVRNSKKEAMPEGERLDYVRNFKKEAMPEGDRLDYVRNFNKEATPEEERSDYFNTFNNEASPEVEKESPNFDKNEYDFEEIDGRITIKSKKVELNNTFTVSDMTNTSNSNCFDSLNSCVENDAKSLPKQENLDMKTSSETFNIVSNVNSPTDYIEPDVNDVQRKFRKYLDITSQSFESNTTIEDSSNISSTIFNIDSTTSFESGSHVQSKNIIDTEINKKEPFTDSIENLSVLEFSSLHNIEVPETSSYEHISISEKNSSNTFSPPDISPRRNVTFSIKVPETSSVENVSISTKPSIATTPRRDTTFNIEENLPETSSCEQTSISTKNSSYFQFSPRSRNVTFDFKEKLPETSNFQYISTKSPLKSSPRRNVTFNFNEKPPETSNFDHSPKISNKFSPPDNISSISFNFSGDTRKTDTPFSFSPDQFRKQSFGCKTPEKFTSTPILEVSSLKRSSTASSVVIPCKRRKLADHLDDLQATQTNFDKDPKELVMLFDMSCTISESRTTIDEYSADDESENGENHEDYQPVENEENIEETYLNTHNRIQDRLDQLQRELAKTSDNENVEDESDSHGDEKICNDYSCKMEIPEEQCYLINKNDTSDSEGQNFIYTQGAWKLDQTYMESCYCQPPSSDESVKIEDITTDNEEYFLTRTDEDYTETNGHSIASKQSYYNINCVPEQNETLSLESYSGQNTWTPDIPTQEAIPVVESRSSNENLLIEEQERKLIDYMWHQKKNRQLRMEKMKSAELLKQNRTFTGLRPNSEIIFASRDKCKCKNKTTCYECLKWADYYMGLKNLKISQQVKVSTDDNSEIENFNIDCQENELNDFETNQSSNYGENLEVEISNNFDDVSGDNLVQAENNFDDTPIISKYIKSQIPCFDEVTFNPDECNEPEMSSCCFENADDGQEEIESDELMDSSSNETEEIFYPENITYDIDEINSMPDSHTCSMPKYKIRPKKKRKKSKPASIIIMVDPKSEATSVSHKRNVVELDHLNIDTNALNKIIAKKVLPKLRKNIVKLPALDKSETSLNLPSTSSEMLPTASRSGLLPPLAVESNNNETYDPFLSAERQMQELIILETKSSPTTLPTTPQNRPKTAPSKYILDNNTNRKLSKQTSDTNLTILPDINAKRRLSIKTTPLSRKSSNNNDQTSPQTDVNRMPVDEMPIVSKYTKSHLVPGIEDEPVTPRHYPIIVANNREKIKNDKNTKNRASVIDPPKDFQDLANKSIDNFEIIENIINQNSTTDNSQKNTVNLNKILFTDSIISEDAFEINPDLINSIDNLSIPEDLKANDHYSTEYDKQMSTLEPSVQTDDKNDNTVFDFDSFMSSFDPDNDDDLLPSLKGFLRHNSVPSSNSSNVSPNSLKSVSTSYLKRSVSVTDPVAKPKNLKNKGDVEKFFNGKEEKKNKGHLPEENNLIAEELFDVDDELYAEYKQYEEMYLKDKQRKTSGRESLSGVVGPHGEKKNREKSQSPENKCEIKPSGDSAYSSLNRSTSKEYAKHGGHGDQEYRRKKSSIVEDELCPSSSGSDVSIPVISRNKKKSTAIHKSLVNSVANPQFESNEFNTQINEHHVERVQNYTSGRRKNSDTPPEDDSENSVHYRNSPEHQERASLRGSIDNLRSSSKNASLDNLTEAIDAEQYRKTSIDSGQHRLPKFCHECGSKYPVSVAKFCVECGAKRLIL